MSVLLFVVFILIRGIFKASGAPGQLTDLPWESALFEPGGLRCAFQWGTTLVPLLVLEVFLLWNRHVSNR